MSIYPNKYKKKCQTCRTSVDVGEGFIKKINDQWTTFCKACVPEQIVAKNNIKVENRLTVEGKVFINYDPSFLPLLRAMPGAKFNREEMCWNVSLADADRRRLLEIADKLHLKVDDSLRNIVKTEQATLAENHGLYPFQIEGVNWLSKQDYALLGDDMGLGKTIQSLMSLPKDSCVIVVCPKSLKYNWANETAQWRKDYTTAIIEDKKKFRFPNKNELIIINYDILPEFLIPPSNIKNNWEAIEKWRIALKELYPQAKDVVLIIDEAHKCKNYKTKRSIQIGEFTRLVGRAWGLTGTPLENRPEDLYGLFQSLNLVSKTFRNLANFRRMFGACQNRFGGWIWGTPSLEVPEVIRRVMLRRKRADVLPDLPGKVYTNLLVNDIDAKLKSDLNESWDKWKDCFEVLGSLPPFEEFSEIREKLAVSKIPAMIEYIESCEEQDVPLVVFSAHLRPLDKLLVRPGWAVISGCASPETRQRVVDAFQAGKLKGIGVSIKAGGVGITLTRAWKELFVDLDWNPASNLQAEDRCARIGQKNTVEITRLVSNHPLDIHVNKLLDKKMRLIENAIEKEVFIVNKPSVSNSNEVVEETVEEFNKRMKIVEETLEEFNKRMNELPKQKAKVCDEKISIIIDREKNKSKQDLLPLTYERKEAIKKSFNYMLSVCDGAVKKDSFGFNKPDSFIASYINSNDLEKDNQLTAAYCILFRYRRQLKDKYPILFEEQK
jgi:SWI/SNF-related matrix-associated actin-dependent regulator 1 of chromatin subfamily A